MYYSPESNILVAGQLEEAISTCGEMVSYLTVSLHSCAPNHPLLGLQLMTLADLLSSVDTSESKRRADILYTWAHEVGTFMKCGNCVCFE
jgi:hypothetical protein